MPITVHKYMSTELGLKSIVRAKKPGYEHGKPQTISENKLDQDFHADSINQKRCTDFTYLFLKGGEVHYNCTIIDLYGCSVVDSVTDHQITSDLAIRILQKALESQTGIKGELILHSDQGSKFTSKAFVEYYESVHIPQSMSKAGYPYDNAPMERYFNTLKCDCIGQCTYETEKAFYQAAEEFVYVTTIMFGLTAIMDIKRHIRKGLRHSAAKRKQIFLAISVTKKLHHNRQVERRKLGRKMSSRHLICADCNGA